MADDDFKRHVVELPDFCFTMTRARDASVDGIKKTSESPGADLSRVTCGTAALCPNGLRYRKTDPIAEPGAK